MSQACWAFLACQSDYRDVEQAANTGNRQAKLALTSVCRTHSRHHWQLYMQCGRTGCAGIHWGIGENSARARSGGVPYQFLGLAAG